MYSACEVTSSLLDTLIDHLTYLLTYLLTSVVYRDADCASLVSTFCQFLVDKVNHIHESIAWELQSTVRRLFTASPYLGPTLSSFRSVTTEKVRRLLSAMPSKSSPLDVLPCSLLKSCSDVFAQN